MALTEIPKRKQWDFLSYFWDCFVRKHWMWRPGWLSKYCTNWCSLIFCSLLKTIWIIRPSVHKQNNNDVFDFPKMWQGASSCFHDFYTRCNFILAYPLWFIHLFLQKNSAFVAGAFKIHPSFKHRANQSNVLFTFSYISCLSGKPK